MNTKISNLEGALTEAKNKLKAYDQQLNSMKVSEKKMRTSLSDL